MGTRNMIMVIDQEGVKKVAQYGQWDGYPSGVGVGLLEFLKDKEMFERMKKNLKKVRFIDEEGVDKDFINSYNKNAPEWSNDPDNRTPEQKHWFSKYISRDLAEEILTNIADSEDSEIILLDRTETATSGGWVEWSYVVNLKENTLTVYEHIDAEPIKIYNLDNLPEANIFIKDLENDEY